MQTPKNVLRSIYDSGKKYSGVIWLLLLSGKIPKYVLRQQCGEVYWERVAHATKKTMTTDSIDHCLVGGSYIYACTCEDLNHIMRRATHGTRVKHHLTRTAAHTTRRIGGRERLNSPKLGGCFGSDDMIYLWVPKMEGSGFNNCSRAVTFCVINSWLTYS